MKKNSKPIVLKWLDFRLSHFRHHDDNRAYINEIEEATNGQVKIEYIQGTKLGPASTHTEMVEKGIVQIANSHPSYSEGKYPIAADISVLPMVYPSAHVAARVINEIMLKYCANAEYKNFKILWFQVTPSLQVHSTEKAGFIKTLNDWKGKIVQASGGKEVTNNQIELMGGIQSFGKGAVKHAEYLKNGQIDICFWGWQPMADGIGKLDGDWASLTKYRTQCNIMFKGWPVLMNLDVWKSLPKDIQQTIDKLSGPERSVWAAKRAQAVENEDRRRVEAFDKRVGNPPVYDLPDNEREIWRKVSEPAVLGWVKALEAKGLPGDKLLADLLSLVAKYS